MPEMRPLTVHQSGSVAVGLETVWKVSASVIVAYAPHHGEQKIPYKSVRG
jgi:hypothetical protein